MCSRGGMEALTLAPTPGRCKCSPGLAGGPQGKAPMCMSTGVHRALYWGGGEEALQAEEYPQHAFLPSFFLISKTRFLNPDIWDWITLGIVGFSSIPGLYPPSHDNQEQLQTLLKHLLGGMGKITP